MAELSPATLDQRTWTGLDPARAKLPSPRDLSLFEVTLFCLLEHLVFRETLPLVPYPALLRFAAEFRERPSARRTTYRFDPEPGAL